MTTLTSTDTIAYTYGNSDWKDQLTSYNGEAITYDEIGNPLSYRGMTMTWQNGRQLATLSKDGLNASYTYNDAGLRLSKTVNGTTTEYYWNGTQLLAQKTGITYLYFLYDETGSAVGYKYNNKTYIYVKNLQGDVISVIDGTTETSLYYLQSRYYDAQTHRFINADGYVFTGQGFIAFNMYSYCLNNPVNRVDDSGKMSASLLLFYKWEENMRAKRALLQATKMLVETLREAYDEQYFVPKLSKTKYADTDVRLMERLQDMGEYYGMENIVITTGYRSLEDQKRLYDAYISGKRNIKAAKPGSSWHNYGGAVDIHSEFLEGLSNADFEMFGLIRPVENEPWHIQIIETRGLSAKKYGEVYFNEINKWDKGK